MKLTDSDFDLFGEIRGRIGTGLTNIVPSNTYTTRDGQSVVIAGNGDSIFKRLMTVIDREDLREDSGLADNTGRVARVTEIDAAIQAWTARHSVDEVLARLRTELSDANARIESGERGLHELDAEPLRHFGVVGVLGDHHMYVDRELPSARARAPTSRPAEQMDARQSRKTYFRRAPRSPSGRPSRC